MRVSWQRPALSSGRAHEQPACGQPAEHAQVAGAAAAPRVQYACAVHQQELHGEEQQQEGRQHQHQEMEEEEQQQALLGA